ncbi:hypothetical protein FOCC_FOCC005056, partial [Frankliniella occidentalis]
MNRTLVICSVLVAMVMPGSPTERRTVKDGIGQQIDWTTNTHTGHQTNGYLALGQNAHASPERVAGQPSTGGQPSTSQKKKKGKG